MSSPAAGFAFNDYRLRTNNTKKRPIPHAEWAKPSQVQRGLGFIQFFGVINLLTFIMIFVEPTNYFK